MESTPVNHRRRRGLATAVAGLAVACLVVAVAGTADAGTSAPERGRGALLSVAPVSTGSAAEVAAALERHGLDDTHVRYDVRAVRITYRTVDVSGTGVTASALVAVPTGAPARLPTVVYTHGTRVDRTAVASMDPDEGDHAVALAFASAGHTTVAPDYLGLGAGDGAHPYLHAATEASASVDAVRAARVLAAREGWRMDQRILAAGFSQGGQAALAVGRAVQSGVDSGLRLAAVAAVSGPYDVRGAQLPAVFDGTLDPFVSAFYLAYWTVSVNRLYGLYGDPAEVFRAPYDATVPVLFDGYHNEGDIVRGLPAAPEDLLTDAYLQRLRHPRGVLDRALRDSDTTCDWRPAVPVRLYRSTADREVSPVNTDHCRRRLAARGARPELVELAGADHGETLARALPQILDWFQQRGASAAGA